jgi:hypothetical protein
VRKRKKPVQAAGNEGAGLMWTSITASTAAAGILGTIEIRSGNSNGSISPLWHEAAMKADFAEWARDNPPPDLQELIARFGSYSAIPASAWIEFDDAMKDWQARYRERGKGPKDGKSR